MAYTPIGGNKTNTYTPLASNVQNRVPELLAKGTEIKQGKPELGILGKARKFLFPTRAELLSDIATREEGPVGSLDELIEKAKKEELLMGLVRREDPTSRIGEGEAVDVTAGIGSIRRKLGQVAKTTISKLAAEKTEQGAINLIKKEIPKIEPRLAEQLGVKISKATEANTIENIFRKADIEIGSYTPLSTKVAKPTITPKIEPLAQEARKFKTAEEFVEKGDFLFHGSSADIKSGKLAFGEGDIRKGGQSGGLFITDTKQSAQTFGRELFRVDPSIKRTVVDLTTPEGRQVIKNQIGKTYKNFDGEVVKFTADDFNSIFPAGKADFATVAQQSEFFEDIIPKLNKRGIAFKEFAGGKVGKTYQILEGDIPVLTKSQLTDIFNKEKTIIPEVKATVKVSTKALVDTPINFPELKRTVDLLKSKEVTREELDQVRLRFQFAEEALLDDPARKLSKFANKKTQELPEVTGKGGIFRTAGDEIVTELGYKNSEEAREAYQQYLTRKNTLEQIKSEVRGVRSEVLEIRKGETLISKAFKERRSRLRALQERFQLTNPEVARFRKGRDISIMTNDEFNSFLVEAQEFGNREFRRQEALVQVKGTIFEKELKKTENLRQAMELPSISQMNEAELRKFDEVLSQFKVGDEFLTVRQLETVKNTDLSQIKTLREAREILAKKTGVPIEELNKIKVSELDRYRYDTALARQNPFYNLMVVEKNKAILDANAKLFKLKEEMNSLFNEARKSKKKTAKEKVLGIIAPTDEKIFKWLEATPTNKLKLAESMTEAELKASKRIQDIYADARDYLVQQGVLKSTISDYITHIRRGFLEAWKDDGLLTSFKEVFKQYKQDEAMFNILNEKTGDILPLEKFFQFSMKRSGELTPTKNVPKAVQGYFSAFYKKQALDALVPELDIYAHSLTPKKLTPRGLEFDSSLKRFVKQWVNTKKGRVVDTQIVSPGGKLDWILRTGVGFTRLMDLGLSIPIGLASSVGEQITNATVMGGKSYSKGLSRLTTKKGRDMTKKYSNFVGETLTERLSEASDGIGDKIFTGMFSLFAAASRRANQIFLLGEMTAEEFAKGAISTQRLAEMQTKMGRFRVVEGFNSIIGKTSAGKVGTQYKTWAVPILSTVSSNIQILTKMLRSGQKGITKTPEFQELARLTILTSVIGLGTYGYATSLKNKKDRTFSEDLVYKSARDAMTLIGALDPTLWFAEPRLLSFFDDLGTGVSQILKLETNKDGDLKGLTKFKNVLTPGALRPLLREKKEITTSGKSFKTPPGLPSLPNFKVSLPKLPSLPKL